MTKRMRIIVPLLLLTLFTSVVMAQSRTLQSGEPVNGVLDSLNPAQVYTFAASEDDIVSLGATAESGLALTLILTDATGNLLAQSADPEVTGSVSILDVPILETGLYYVTVFPSPDAGTRTSGAFRLTLESTIAGTDDGETVEVPDATPTSSDDAAADAVPTATLEAPVIGETPPTEAAAVEFGPGQVLTTTGLQVSLTWDTTADMNLQVRDPVGQTLFFDSRETNNGGTFGFDVNGLCEILTADNPTETATWSPGAVATGSYEILVFYRQDCEGSGPTNFTVNVTVDGQSLPPVQATLPAPINDVVPVYLASFRVNADGTAELGPNGQYQDTRVLPIPAEEILAEPATPLVPEIPQQGLITTSNYFDTYTFEGFAGETVEISMTALNGNLDTLLLVLDESGRVVGDNDDIIAGNVTNSAINNPPLRLPFDGTYTVMATRYGKDVGGTEGNYEILLSSGAEDIPEELVNLGLPDGSIEVLLTWNTNADLQLLVRDPEGQSVFDDNRSVRSGGQLVADGNINCTPAETTPVSYIYWPTGLVRGGSYEVEVWYQNECNDATPVNPTLFITVNGEQVLAETFSPQVGNRYLTSFVIDTTGQVNVGESGFIGGSETLTLLPTFETKLANAPELTSGQSLPGTITSANKFDVYVFDANAGDIATLSMQATQGALDTKLFLISPSLFEIAENDDAVVGETTDSLISELVLGETGQYIVIATHFGTIYGGTTGNYEITLTLN